MVPSSDDTRDAERPLGQIAARGARLAIVGWGASQGLNFAAYIVLARLLDPGDFGTFAAGSILIAFGVLFAESGTMAALISRRDRIDEAASTAFFSLVVSGLLLSLVSLAASPLVGLFFQNHRAGVVAAALSGWLFLRAMTIVPDSLLQRRFSYARRVAVDPLGAIAFAAVAIATCATGAGVWGLVWGTYASEVVEVAAAWAFARYRPRRKLASMAMWREIAVLRAAGAGLGDPAPHRQPDGRDHAGALHQRRDAGPVSQRLSPGLAAGPGIRRRRRLRPAPDAGSHLPRGARPAARSCVASTGSPWPARCRSAWP